jgi:hypothetical protein
VRLEQAVEATSSVVPNHFDRFRQHIDPVWVEEALCATGFASLRRRRLPADQVIWLVLGMALMRNESIQRVASLLGLAMPSGKQVKGLAPSAFTQARQRLGDEPMAYLFGSTSAEWATRSARSHAWRGLAVYLIDGTTLRVPDSKENWAAFGGQVGNGSRAGSAYPTMRAVALMAARSHLITAVEFGPYKTGEVTLAAPLWAKLPEQSLIIGDRNFGAIRDLHRVRSGSKGRHWLVRAKQQRFRVVKKLGTNEDLVELTVTKSMLKTCPELPATMMMRAIRYQRPGFKPVTLLTSLLEPKAYPATELIALYHERWEIELGYGEIKTHQLARQEAIRSRTPEGVRQELWGILLAYNLVRVEMERAANEAGVEPRRMSFVNALTMIRTAWIVWSTEPVAPGRIPEHLLDLRRHIGLLLLPERRSKRCYPRVVKIKMSNYDKKWVRRPVLN